MLEGLKYVNESCTKITSSGFQQISKNHGWCYCCGSGEVWCSCCGYVGDIPGVTSNHPKVSVVEVRVLV